MGYDEATAAAMEKFTRDAQKHKQSEGCHGVHLYSPIPGDELKTMPHHELLLPHWKMIAQTLPRLKSNGIGYFFVDYIDMPKEVLNEIAPVVQTIDLKTMILTSCNLGRHGLLFLSRFLEGNSTLEFLGLSRNQLDDLDAVNFFSRAVANHPRLERLSLDRCGLGNNSAILAAVIGVCKKVSEVSLEYNNIGSNGAAVISDFLSGNPHTTSLRLVGNKINDCDINSLALALRTNSNLRYLDLRQNAFSDRGKSRIVSKACLDTSSLNSIVDSNHFCDLKVLEEDTSITNNMNRMNLIGEGDFAMISRLARKKILFLFSQGKGQRMDIRYFEAVPLTLVPFVLAFIQQPSDLLFGCLCFRGLKLSYDEFCLMTARWALGRIYHLMRNWKMPLLYQNRDESTRADRKRKRIT